MWANIQGPRVYRSAFPPNGIMWGIPVTTDHYITEYANPHGIATDTPWYSHPAVKMWRGYEQALAVYGFFICAEWKLRGFNDSLIGFFEKRMGDVDSVVAPPWLGDEDFHLSHQSNLVRKLPEHYRKLFPSVPDNLEYVWPV